MSFLNALKNKQQTTPQVRQSTPQSEPLKVKIERVLNRNRIDLYFNRKPETETIELLKSNGFRWSPENRKWYNKDSGYILQFLEKTFKTSFTEETPKNEAQNASPLNDLPTTNSTAYPEKTVIKLSGNNLVIPMESPEQKKFAKYCRQIDELKSTLNMDLQEILFEAIDLYYQSEITN